MYDEYSSIIKYPANAIKALSGTILPHHIPRDSSVQLSIVVDSVAITARDFSSYLKLLDQVYGRLDSEGLPSYAHRKEGHLEIAEVRSGSVELLIKELVGSAEQLAILYLVAKYLPTFIRDLLAAYRDYEEARFTRLRKKQLRDEMRQDAELSPISEHYRNQLVDLLDTMFSLQRNELPGAQRFARRQVRKIEITLVDEEIDDPEVDED